MALYGVQATLPMADEDLLFGLENRRSSQATALQQAQAQMGGLGQQPPRNVGSPPGPSGQQGGSRLRQLMESRRAEAEQLQSRGNDLQVIQRLMQVLDPRLPKQARQFLFKELSQSLGIDPRGQRSKEIGQMLTSLDPEVSESMRRTLVQQSETSQPGRVAEIARGILTGQVPIQQVVNMMPRQMPTAGEGGGESGPGAALSTATAPAGGGSSTIPPPMRLGAGSLVTAGQPGGSDSMVMQAQAPGRPGESVGPRDERPARLPFTSEEPSSTIARYREQELAPHMREIAPELANVLHLDQNTRYRNQDVIRGGFSRIPTDYDGQQRMATDIRNVQIGVIDAINMASSLAGLVRGNPEALNILRARIPFTDTMLSLNVPSILQQVRDFGNGLGNVFGNGEIRPDQVNVGRWGAMANSPGDHGSPALRAARENIALMARIQGAAIDNARINSVLVPLAFAMAAAKGQSGRFLSDRDVEAQLQEIGNSASPAMFEANLRDTVSRLYNGYRVRMQAQIGSSVPLGPAVPDDIARSIALGRIAPDEMLTELGLRPSRPQREQLQRRTEADTTPQETGAAAFAQPAIAPETVQSTRTAQERTSLERRGPTIEAEEERRRAQQEEDRAAILERRTQQRRASEINESQEARAARGEERAVEKERRDRIERAMAHIARALQSSAFTGASTGGNISSAGAGGDQDAAAFRITPAPARRPPQPVEAYRFQRR